MSSYIISSMQGHAGLSSYSLKGVSGSVRVRELGCFSYEWVVQKGCCREPRRAGGGVWDQCCAKQGLPDLEDGDAVL